MLRRHANINLLASIYAANITAADGAEDEDEDEDDRQKKFKLDARHANASVFAVQYSLARTVQQQWGVTPAAVLGYSIGELSAACISGAITLLDVCKMFGHVEYKGFDANKSDKGGMALIGQLSRSILETVLEGVNDARLVISARYSATDHMLSGPVKSLDLVLRTLDAADYGACHQKLVRPPLSTAPHLADHVFLGNNCQ